MTLRRPRTFRGAVRAAMAVVVVAVIATTAVAATASHGTTYRTAVVARSTVSEELQLTGTIEPVAQATVAFPTAGTVAAVTAKVGQTVATGQTLATLDPSSLQAAVSSKEAALAAAQLTLEKARNGESTGGGAGNGTGGGATPNGAASTPAATSAAATNSAAPSNTGTKASASTSSAAVSAARQAVSRDQGRVQTALAASQTALKTATTACTTIPTDTAPTTTTGTTDTTSTTSTTATSPAGADPQACATAQANALRSLQSLATAEATLAKDQATLSQLLQSASTPTQSTTPTTSAAAPTSNTVTYTAAQLAAYEADVAAAAAEVAAAEETLAQATIVSPINGTIAAVNLAVGATVSATSSTANIVIVGNGGYEVTTTVTVAQRAKVKVGDGASVVADGTGTKLSGKVVAIGVATTSNGTTTYPVVVGFTGTATGKTALRYGASASLSIVVAHTVNALAVPTSAVHTIGTFHSVTVLTNGKPTTVRVQLGTVGAERTVITSGVEAGQIVVLADLGAAIPSAGTNTGPFGGGFGGNRTFGGGPTRFGG